jgi:hypothetical protein
MGLPKRSVCLIGITAATAMLLLAVVNPTTVFELEGNVADDAAISLPDWNTLNGDCTQEGGGSGSPGGSNARTCIDAENPPTIFTGGGSKDPSDIPSWKWKAADTVPDKNTITHGFSASFTSGGSKVVVIGADRFAVNGDANIGAWLFQKEIKLNSNGTFSGVHTNGDVFLVSAFKNGGGVSIVQAYKWDSTCSKPPGNATPTPGNCAEDNLRFLGTSGTFGITNSANITDATWSYQAKFGLPGNTMPPGAFFEAAADLTELFGTSEVPCFSSFLLETRSSAEPSAVLKDLVLGSFPECKISVAKSCNCTGLDAAGPNPTNGTGYNYTFNGTVTNDGGGTVFDVQVSDQGKTYNCGTMNATTSKTFGGASAVAVATATQCAGPAGTFSDDVFPTNNQATATAKTAETGGTTLNASSLVVSCSGQATANACTPSTLLTVDKTCVTALVDIGSNVVVRVDYTGQVKNGSNVNLNSVQVTEDHDADGTVDVTFSMGTLTAVGTAGADKCYTRAANDAAQPLCPSLPAIPLYNASTPTGAASYFPATGTGVTPGRAQFSDKVRATATNPFGGTVVSHAVGDGITASCTVCPFGSCPATQ